MTITCTTYEKSLYTNYEGKVKQVILKNAKNIDMRFLNKNDVLVDIETDIESLVITSNKIFITLKDEDVSESWYGGEW